MTSIAMHTKTFISLKFPSAIPSNGKDVNDPMQL